MARQTTKKAIETPEGRANYMTQLMRECEILRAEVDRLNIVIKYKDITINTILKANENISDELSKERNK
jgi:hypothetical protein